MPGAPPAARLAEPWLGCRPYVLVPGTRSGMSAHTVPLVAMKRRLLAIRGQESGQDCILPAPCETKGNLAFAPRVSDGRSSRLISCRSRRVLDPLSSGRGPFFCVFLPHFFPTISLL